MNSQYQHAYCQVSGTPFEQGVQQGQELSDAIRRNLASVHRKLEQEKVDLQVSQCSFKLKEARKKYAMATKNVDKAEENLRCANVGFKEGVLQTTDVMEAQTAWMQAQSQKIDSEVEIKIAQVNLKKAIGHM